MKKTLSLLDKNKRFFLLTLLVGIVYSAISVAIPTISGRLITSVVADSANRTRLLCIFLLVSLFQLCFAELDEYMGNTLKIRQKKQMRRNAFHAFSAQDSAKREDISAFVSFVNNDIPSVAEQYVLGAIDMIKCMSILTFSALSLLYIHWVLALVIVGVSLLIVALPNTMRKRGGAARKRYSGVLANYNTTLRSILDGLRLVKAYRCRKYAAESVDSADDGIARSEMTLLKYQLVTQGITTALQVAKTVLILLIGLYLISKKEIDVGSLVAVIQLAEVISAPIEVLAYLRHGRNEVLPILAQYQSMIGRKPEGDDRRTACAGALEQLAVDHLSYRAEELAILKDVCARFTAGRKYLITGESGIGKSEVALELIHRGHRLVSDDVVEIKRVSKKSLIGTSPEVTRFFIELRGIGIIDVKNLYGVESVKMEQEINLVIQLEDWNKDTDYDRLGLEEKYVEYLGNKVAAHTLPIRPGRNLAIIVEAAAINHRQKKMGYNAAEELYKRVTGQMED